MERPLHGDSWVTTEILRYLVAHPDAKDTVDGIARWWISPGGDQDRREWSRAMVQEAVDELVARGWIVRRETASAHVVYGLDKQHLSAITKVITGQD